MKGLHLHEEHVLMALLVRHLLMGCSNGHVGGSWIEVCLKSTENWGLKRFVPSMEMNKDIFQVRREMQKETDVLGRRCLLGGVEFQLC